ncbi:hypothetical protein [Streptomyces lavendofoliae]|uniref:hypothetical protein n=1 Tax=Streptomyces lavendofoliae TaxID=67314 RepID=UPI003D91B535
MAPTVNPAEKAKSAQSVEARIADAREAAQSASELKLKTAYDVIVKLAAQQDATLGNYRTRATAIFTVAALIGAFVSNIGFIAKEKPPPIGYLIALMVTLTVVLALALAVLWPIKGWTVGPDPAGVLMAEEEPTGNVYRVIVLGQLRPLMIHNDQAMRRKARYFRWGVIALAIEVLLVVAAALASRREGWGLIALGVAAVLIAVVALAAAVRRVRS